MRKPRPEKQFYKIGEAAEIVGVPAHVLRYWEAEFSMVKPMKTRGSHRMYRPRDVELLVCIKKLMHEQGYTLEGAKRQLRSSRRSGALGHDRLQLAQTKLPLEEMSLNSGEVTGCVVANQSPGALKDLAFDTASAMDASLCPDAARHLGISAPQRGSIGSKGQTPADVPSPDLAVRGGATEAALRLELYRVRERLRALRLELDDSPRGSAAAREARGAASDAFVENRARGSRGRESSTPEDAAKAGAIVVEHVVPRSRHSVSRSRD